MRGGPSARGTGRRGDQGHEGPARGKWGSEEVCFGGTVRRVGRLVQGGRGRRGLGRSLGKSLAGRRLGR